MDVAHAGLDQTTREQTAGAERRVAILLADALRLFANVEQLQRLELHAIGRLHRLDAAFEKCVGAERLRVVLVEALQRVHVGALCRRVHLFVPQIRDDLLGIRIVDLKAYALILGRQECRPGLRSAAVRAQRDERRQVLVLGAETVRNPRAHRRPCCQHAAGVEQGPPRCVRRVEGVHRSNDAHVVDDAGELRQQLAHLDAIAPVALELERRRQQPARRALGAQVDGARTLSRVLGQRRLGIEHVELRRPAVHVKHDDVLGLGRQRRPGIVSKARRLDVAPRQAGKHAGEADEADATAQRFDHFPSGQLQGHGRKISSLVDSRTCA